MNTVLNIATLAILAVASIVVAHAVLVYRANENSGHGLARVWSTARDSATWFWGKFSFVLSGISLNLDKIADALGQPQITDSLDKIGANPKTIGAVLLVTSLVTLA